MGNQPLRSLHATSTPFLHIVCNVKVLPGGARSGSAWSQTCFYKSLCYFKTPQCRYSWRTLKTHRVQQQCGQHIGRTDLCCLAEHRVWSRPAYTGHGLSGQLCVLERGGFKKLMYWTFWKKGQKAWIRNYLWLWIVGFLCFEAPQPFLICSKKMGCYVWPRD